jgi:hypothetical protein
MALKPKDMVELLLQVCPSATSVWNDHVEWWKGQERGYYNDMGVFADHLVDSHGKSQNGEFQAFFQLVERFIVEGDDEVRGLAVVGLLETVQLVASHTEDGDKVFEPFLLPQSRQAWNELHELWTGKASLMDVIRSQKRDA